MTGFCWKLWGILLVLMIITTGFVTIARADVPDFKPYKIIIEKVSGDVYLQVINTKNNSWSGYVKIGIKYHGATRSPVIRQLYFEPEGDLYTVYLFNINDRGYGYDEGQAMVEVHVNQDTAVDESDPDNNVRQDLISFIKVNNVGFSLSPLDWTGQCPKTFTAKATLHVVGRGSVVCRFETRGWSSKKIKLVSNVIGPNVLQTGEVHFTLPNGSDSQNTRHQLSANVSIWHPQSEIAVYTKRFTLDCSNK